MITIVFCLLYSTDFTEEQGRGFGRFFGCNEYKRPLRGGRACCSASEALLFSSCGVCLLYLQTLVHQKCLPTMVAKIKTPAKKSATTNKYSASFSGVGVSPIVVNRENDRGLRWDKPNNSSYIYTELIYKSNAVFLSATEDPNAVLRMTFVSYGGKDIFHELRICESFQNKPKCQQQLMGWRTDKRR
uniref:Uncharacterized protein n=1 Tax=Glossina austeni TaxID=7395 RepID=A0A1A9VU25_GLOAU